jgi:hypothetical protein
VDLLRREVDRYPVKRPQDLIDERLVLARLLHDEVTATLLCDLDECVARHVLNTCGGQSS